jgi:hypothetical protein
LGERRFGKNAMKRSSAMYLATAAFGALLTVGSAAWGQNGRTRPDMGNYCATPTKTCRLSHGSMVIGTGCSCNVRGGRERGKVASAAARSHFHPQMVH